jgi:hypothetical protein
MTTDAPVNMRTVHGLYHEWFAAQQEADKLRDRMFGIRVRHTTGREGPEFFKLNGANGS